MPRKNDVPIQLNPTFWKALGSLASTDETRATFTCVHVRSPRVFEVTDGHCALQVTLDEDTPLAPGLYDPKATAARVKAGVEPVPHPRDKFDAAHFPNFDPILRAPVTGYAERCDVGLNPELVSRVNDAAAGVILAVTGAKGIGLMWSIGDDLDAVILTGKAPGLRIHAAVMPMRVEGPRRRPEKDTFDADGLKADIAHLTATVKTQQQENDALRAEAARFRDDAERHAEALKHENRRAERFVEELSQVREDVFRLTAELNEAREAADTDAADALRARAAVEELRAELNALRHLRPKNVEPEPVLLTRPTARA